MKGAAYVLQVQDRYLALRGGGLTLSPVDTDLIRGWRDRGVPLELALLGLGEAWESRQQAGRGARARPFQLRHAEAYVLALHEAYARRSGGLATGLDAVRSPRIDEVRGALQHIALTAQGPAREGHLAAIAALDLGGPPDDALHAADAAQALAYLAALSRQEQRKVSFGARRFAGLRRDVPRRAYRATLRGLLGEAARAHGGFPRPSDLP